ncbi:dynein heavy chain 3, axonemal [Eurytemora carolleeae]|uniref:dynein heavy chain 3, axonemal n=1 Tax=Eurytemora carolleeae TaxID=1294199 RepID=UPI000C7791AF|nr:dynein heavy chain 3, axonemal [Eurytemora carolleeae]|eukprot:XP_023329300.1 dynein heavy chain 3, axonemal-like [Eurytemora affinis]
MAKFPYKSCQRCHGMPKSAFSNFKEQRPASAKRRKVSVGWGQENYSHIPQASRPSSPDTQLSSRILKPAAQFTKDEMDRYEYCLNVELMDQNVEALSKQQYNRIKSLCKPGWFNDLMMKSKISVLHLEVEEQHSEASRKAILDYLLLDPQEQRRLEIQNVAQSWTPLVVRAPVPWHQTYLQANQFCRHNLFTLNTVLEKINNLWWRRYNNLRFVSPARLRTVDGGPVSPRDFENRVFSQCEEARNLLIKRWLPEVGMILVKERQAWADLVPKYNSIWNSRFAPNTITSISPDTAQPVFSVDLVFVGVPVDPVFVGLPVDPVFVGVPVDPVFVGVTVDPVFVCVQVDLVFVDLQ